MVTLANEFLISIRWQEASHRTTIQEDGSGNLEAHRMIDAESEAVSAGRPMPLLTVIEGHVTVSTTYAKNVMCNISVLDRRFASGLPVRPYSGRTPVDNGDQRIYRRPGYIGTLVVFRPQAGTGCDRGLK
ncbi:unnamed protein product [Soboliphyme baturini]|uniref:Lipocalin-like domain-containing protein n=1 Tax=Soboliphyme baturini TaxID=241478 RepID=A0A183J4S9_9BILA|nr:unnamed protein product [Soboliphyme baturini]